MAGNEKNPWIRGQRSLTTPFCRQNELEEITAKLRGPGARAVFLSSEMGLGTTSLLRQLAKTFSRNSAVVMLHGTPSLSSIPFGILTPYLRRASLTFVDSHVDAIRKTLALLDGMEAELRIGLGSQQELGQPLMIIDEADFIDSATARVAVSLAQVGKIQIVVAHRAGSDPMSPLLKLWESGIAEKFRLQPLSLEAAHSFCAAVLGGQLTSTTSWYFWNAAGGNPLLMRLVMEDALSSGKLRQAAGQWVMNIQSVPVGHQLQSVVREQLRGLSPNARNTVDLVALSEPVSSAMVSQQFGAESLQELFDRRFLEESTAGSGLVRLVNAVYGDVIREMMPRSQSRTLYNRLVEELRTEPQTPESMLRMVIWTLESGLTVPDNDLLKAAVFACKVYDSDTALRLAEHVVEKKNQGRAYAIMARAKFNVGDYEAADSLLEQDPGSAGSVADLLFGGLLRAANRSALMLPPELIHDDATALRVHGERLARRDMDSAPDILLRSQERAEILDLMAYSRAGRYQEMTGPIDRVLNSSSGTDDADHLCNKSMALAMDAERLSAIGRPMSARVQAAAAFAIVQEEDHDVYFVPEMIISRALVASLTAGEWDEAEQILQSFAVDVGMATISFGGSGGVVRGMVLLRQGRTTLALAGLLRGLDALGHNDPQHLRGFCVSMGAYAAAKVGNRDTARQLLEQYSEGAGMRVVVTHEQAFIAAAREYLDREGTGLAELLRIADENSANGLLMPELNALSLILDFDPTRALQRLQNVALQVEGPWAAGMSAYAAALQRRSAADLVQAAGILLEAQMFQHAGQVLRLAESTLARGHSSHLSGQVKDGLERVDFALGSDSTRATGRDLELSHNRKKLTARELEIASMAAGGRTDRSIAAELHVSIRTVEGHLYRVYAKLEITDRKDLVLVLL